MSSILRRVAAMVVAAMLPCFVHATAANENYQGLWWNASESGWGLSIAHQGDTMMAAWLAYDASGQAAWLVLPANRAADGTYSGTIYEARVASGPYLAGLPFDPSRVSRTPVGQASLAFADRDNGTLRYSMRGIERTKSITREVFGPLPECTYAAQPELANADNYTDLWWAAHGTEPGWGVAIAHEGDTLFAAWLTYDPNGAPRWFVVAAPKIAKGVYGGALLRTSGPALESEKFDTAAVTRTAAGNATFTFSNGNAATLTVIGNDGAVTTKALNRELFAPPAGTVCRASAAPIKGRVFAAAPIAANVCADTNGNGACDAGEPSTASGADGSYTLDVGAGYNGALVAETPDGYRMSSPGPGYSANITPYTTLVRLSGERDFAIAEMMVRNELGLPALFAIRLDAPPAGGSLAQSIAGHIVAALKAAAPGPQAEALARVVAAFPPALTDIPQLRITTENRAPVVSKEDYVNATYVLVNPAAATPTANLNGRIRGRGNFTWGLPKKPYKVQFTNDALLAALPDVLGMPRSRYWALLADYMDRALMRNQLVMTLGNSSLFSEGIKFTPQTARVEVWLNGEYEGLFTLIQEIRVDADRLNIHKIGASDMDGGYLAEVDWPLDCYNGGTINLQHITPQGVHICLKTPDEGSATTAQIAWIFDYIDGAENDLYNRGVTDRLNLVSYADWYLMNELVRNYDAPFYSSDYMWKDTSAAAIPGDRRLNMGPFWDFDLSGGDIQAGGNASPVGCWVDRLRPPDPAFPDGTLLPNWFNKLSETDAFVRFTTARWKDKSAALRRLADQSIAAFSRRLAPAAERNFERWPELTYGTMFEASPAATYSGSVADLASFLDQRIAWMDQAFDSASSFDWMCR